jgi:hypothetical protein
LGQVCVGWLHFQHNSLIKSFYARNSPFIEKNERQNVVLLLSPFFTTELRNVNFAVSCFRENTRNSDVFGPKNEFRDEFRQIHLRVEEPHRF